MNTTLEQISEEITETSTSALRELASMELALVGGGFDDPAWD